MGYETIDKNHFWLDDNLEMVKPVPEEHIEGTKSIGCNYFQEAKDEKESVSYLIVAKRSQKVECTVHGRKFL